ncbi:MAG: pilus assembly protein [Deltaproteobacteria bacterium]|nr:MAG: pilus assembly protein [Deltaproteobacteria bacterium]
MAIALPLLLLIIAGVVDLGFLFWEKEVLTNAAREGARAGVQGKISGATVVAAWTETDIRTRMQTYLRNLNIKDAAGSPITLTSGNCTFTWNTSPTPPQLTVTLQNIPVNLMMLPKIQNLFTGGIDNILYLQARCTMAREW